MPTYTTNLNLKKPNGDEFYNIADFNENADLIDAAVSKLYELEEDTYTKQETESLIDTAIGSALEAEY